MTVGRGQVALLTRGLRLPEPPLHPMHVAIIVEAICEAWEAVVAEAPDTAISQPERVVNAALITHLKHGLRRRTPFSTLVSHVERGIEQHSFDGRKFENRPDLNFLLTGRDRHFPFVGECKIIDHASRQGVAKYKANGIARFEKGEYAWANAEGIMVAYVRDASKAPTALAGVVGSTPIAFEVATRTHHRSSHPRRFSYVDRDPITEPPGDIAIFHVWLADGVRTDAQR